MEKSCRLWALALGLGIGFGCAGEEPTSAPPSASAPRPAAKPAETPQSGITAKTPPAATKEESKAPPSKKEDAGKSDAPSLEGPKADASSEATKVVKLDDAEMAKIKELPPAEQEVALKQQVCPVSGEHLGSMGKPFKITALDRTFYLCCKGCEKDVKADPKSVIAKLDKK